MRTLAAGMSLRRDWLWSAGESSGVDRKFHGSAIYTRDGDVTAAERTLSSSRNVTSRRYLDMNVFFF